MTDLSAQSVLRHAAGAEQLKLEKFLPYRLNVCSSLVTQALSRIYAERYRMGVSEWRVLVTLGELGPMTAKAVGLHSHMHKTKVSRAVALLERRKLVSRRVNRADLREAFLSLTAAGREVYKDLAPAALEFVRQLHGVGGPGRPRRARSRAHQADRALGATEHRCRHRARAALDCQQHQPGPIP